MSWKTFKERMLVKFDKKMMNWENKGYHTANKMHRYAANALFLYMGYLIFSFLASYNDLLLRARSVNKYEEKDLEGAINKDD